jgi:hypothetical protein
MRRYTYYVLRSTYYVFLFDSELLIAHRFQNQRLRITQLLYSLLNPTKNLKRNTYNVQRKTYFSPVCIKTNTFAPL